MSTLSSLRFKGTATALGCVIVAGAGISVWASGALAYLSDQPSSLGAKEGRPRVSAAVTARKVPVVQRPSHPFQYDSTLVVQGTRLESALGGRLVSSKTWTDGTLTWQCHQVLSPNVRVAGSTQVNTNAPGIETPFCVATDAASERVTIALSPRVTQSARQLFVGLAGALQYRASGSDVTEWRHKETDAAGPYEAAYRRVDPRAVHKSKIEYMPSAAGLSVQASEARFTFDTDQELVALRFHEELSEPSLNLKYSTTLRLQASLESGGLNQDASSKVPAGYERKSIDVASELDPEEAALAAPKIPFEEAFETLVQSGETAFEPQDFLAVVASLRAHPAELDQVDRALGKRPQFASQLGALLAAVNSEESRKVLVKVMTSRSHGVEVRLHLMQNLLFRGEVDQALLSAVEQMAKDDEERIALGAIQLLPELIARAEKTESIQTAELRERYVQDAKSCGTRRRCSAFATGLGYLGGDPAMQVLSTLLTDESSEVRSSVVSALELANDDRADAWLAWHMAQETSDRLRARTVRACSMRGSRICAEAVARLLRGGNAQDQLAAMDALARGRFPRDLALQLMTQAKSSIREHDMRERLQSLLEKMKTN